MYRTVQHFLRRSGTLYIVNRAKEEFGSVSSIWFWVPSSSDMSRTKNPNNRVRQSEVIADNGAKVRFANSCRAGC